MQVAGATMLGGRRARLQRPGDAEHVVLTFWACMASSTRASCDCSSRAYAASMSACWDAATFCVNDGAIGCIAGDAANGMGAPLAH